MKHFSQRTTHFILLKQGKTGEMQVNPNKTYSDILTLIITLIRPATHFYLAVCVTFLIQTREIFLELDQKFLGHNTSGIYFVNVSLKFLFIKNTLLTDTPTCCGYCWHIAQIKVYIFLNCRINAGGGSREHFIKTKLQVCSILKGVVIFRETACRP